MLIPEVHEMFLAGKIHEFDAEWIGRLPTASQLASAKKCMAASPTMLAEDNPKSSVTHGTPSTQPRRR